jgi:carboxymethylenebutenolidase
MKILLSVALLTIAVCSQAQQMCCAVQNAQTAFANLGANKAFMLMHDEPGVANYDNTRGKQLQFKTKGKTANGWLIKSKTKSNKYFLVIHEWWGLNGFVKAEAIKLADAFTDINILCIDMYDGKLATTRDSAGAYMKAMTQTRGEEIINGAIAFAGKKASFYTVGWCFGGGWSLQAAILAGIKGKGCIMYYGMPETNLEKLKKLQAPVLCIHPTQDKWITQAVVDAFKENMQKVNKQLSVLQYDADHAFANPSNTKNYNQNFADDAFTKLKSFVNEQKN